MRKWVKLHVKILSEPKILRLTDRNFRMFANLIALGGYMDEDDGGLGTLDDIASHLRLTPKRTAAGLADLCAAGIVARSSPGSGQAVASRNSEFFLKNWGEYNGLPLSDSKEKVLERVHKHREKEAKPKQRNAVTNSLHRERNAPRVEESRGEENRGEESIGADAPSPGLPTAAHVFEENGGKWPLGKLVDGTTKKDAAIQFIVEHVPNTADDLSFWGQVVFAYQKQWSPKSYSVMINDYFLRHRLPGGQNTDSANGSGKTADRNLRAYMEAEHAKQ